MTTVVVSADFCKYVAAMAEAWPDKEELPWPTKSEVHWPFMDRSVLFVFEEKIYIEFLLISHTTELGVVPLEHPQPDEQPVLAMCLLDSKATGGVIIKSPDGAYVARHRDLPLDVQPQHSLFIHPPLPWLNPDGQRECLITDGNFAWGVTVHKHDEHPYLGYAARWERSFVEAVGHRMSMLTEPRYERMPRPERRAIQRTQVPYRLLQLRTPDRATASSAGTHPVAWSKRWAVRGHWRNQPYGPRNNPEYRQKWIDPYIKGPEDMPLDIRPTVFNLGKRPQDRLFKMGEHRGESG